jgi:acetyl-CoA C-acetyltransferase
MSGIRDKVAIIGMGCTRFGELWDKSQEDLVIDSCFEAFEDAGIESKDIDACWLGTVDGGNLGSRLTRILKLQYVPVTRIENLCATGTDAFRNACYAVAAGGCEMALVCGVEKLKDTGYEGALGGTLDAEYQSRIEVSVGPPTMFGVRATQYFEAYGLTPEKGKEILSKIAVKNHYNGARSSKAQFQKEITVEQAIKAPVIAAPLGIFDCCGVTDGSAAAIITTPEKAKEMGKDYVLVKGLGMCNNAAQPVLDDDYDFIHFQENKVSAQRAYDEAGITNPREEIDVAIVHDCFTITEMIVMEDLGFSKEGEAWKDYEEGFFSLDGGLPVNTDGGLKCFGHPLGATGLRMIYEVYNQLKGRCGERQLKDPKIGLTHNLAGNPDCYCIAISILGKPE